MSCGFFFQIVVLDGPLGETSCYAIRVEFQVTESLHIRSVTWISSEPTLK